jgi:hypothetical protein
VSYRGRLLRPFLAEFERLDTDATESANGYDPIWKTPRVSYLDGTRATGQQYLAAIRVRAQVEVVTQEQLQQAPGGNIPDSMMRLVVHISELEQRSLIDADGMPMIRVNDRLIAIYTLGGVLEERYAKPLYITSVDRPAFGIGGRRNLAVFTAEDRPQGARL